MSVPGEPPSVVQGVERISGPRPEPDQDLAEDPALILQVQPDLPLLIAGLVKRFLEEMSVLSNGSHFV